MYDYPRYMHKPQHSVENLIRDSLINFVLQSISQIQLLAKNNVNHLLKG
eukprot:UN02215